ncbi:MAG: hypothetical protein SFU86_24560 [Pirellulaceae bacterium]|nr:hypothetical protein [Pirellulaceae bacterium]
MIRFTVVWDAVVEAHFLQAWLESDAATRAILSEVATTIDRTLAVDAHTKGELQANPQVRGEVIQVAKASISVFYEVETEERIVRVVRLVFRRTT